MNVKNKNGELPLTVAIERGFDKIVELLVQNGADVNAQDSLGESSLSVAAYKGYDKIADTLIKNSANVNHEVSYL